MQLKKRYKNYTAEKLSNSYSKIISNHYFFLQKDHFSGLLQKNSEQQEKNKKRVILDPNWTPSTAKVIMIMIICEKKCLQIVINGCILIRQLSIVHCQV